MYSGEQHLEKIERLNQLIALIQRKLDAGDYMVHTFSEFVKPIQYIHVQLQDLNVYLSPIKTSVEGHFYYKDYKDFKAPYVLVHNNVFKRKGVRLDDSALAHELQHYLDWRAGLEFSDFKEILKPEGGINPAYFNDPTEWRAFTIQILRQYFQRVKLRKMPENFLDFQKDFMRKTDGREFYAYLTPENRQRFNKYLEDFHKKLLEKKHSVNEIIGEEIQKFAYSIPDLAKMMERQGFDLEGQKILQDMLMDAYRKSGDQGVIDMYQQMGGVEIQALRNGRYVFADLSGGGEPMLEVQDNANHTPDEMPS